MTVDLFQPNENYTGVVTDENNVTTVTLPASITAGYDPIASGAVASYKPFTCSRNFPRCVSDAMQLDECLSRCEQISGTLGEFAEACMAAEQAEEEAGTGKTFTCFTMRTLDGDRGGCVNEDGTWKEWCECGRSSACPDLPARLTRLPRCTRHRDAHGARRKGARLGARLQSAVHGGGASKCRRHQPVPLLRSAAARPWQLRRLRSAAGLCRGGGGRCRGAHLARSCENEWARIMKKHGDMDKNK